MRMRNKRRCRPLNTYHPRRPSPPSTLANSEDTECLLSPSWCFSTVFISAASWYPARSMPHGPVDGRCSDTTDPRMIPSHSPGHALRSSSHAVNGRKGAYDQWVRASRPILSWPAAAKPGTSVRPRRAVNSLWVLWVHLTSHFRPLPCFWCWGPRSICSETAV